MPAPVPATTTTRTVSQLFTLLEALLGTYGSWTIYKYHGSNISRLLMEMPHVNLPACVICYEGSHYYKYPDTRRPRIHIVCAVQEPQNLFTEGFLGATALAEKAVELLDQQILTGARARVDVVEDNALDLGPTISAIDVEFDIHDH